MNPLYEAAIEVQGFMAERGWRSCIIGGLAIERWGEPRVTRDVDMTLLTGVGSEENYVQELLARFAPRRPDAGAFALITRVLLLRAANDTPVDVALGGFDYEEEAVKRGSPFEYAPGVSLVTCSAEDLVVLKAFASREGDWLDIKGILVRQSGKLDWRYIRRQLKPLCDLKEEPEILDRLEALRKKLDKPNRAFPSS
jgi:hypothetical protein